jgi:hypothetical protein
MQNNLGGQLLDYIALHIQIVGWPAICFAVWKVTRFITEIQERACTAEQHITKMATNCFPTMEASLKNQDVFLHSMDGSLKTLVERQSPASPRRRKK